MLIGWLALLLLNLRDFDPFLAGNELHLLAGGGSDLVGLEGGRRLAPFIIKQLGPHHPSLFYKDYFDWEITLERLAGLFVEASGELVGGVLELEGPHIHLDLLPADRRVARQLILFI